MDKMPIADEIIDLTRLLSILKNNFVLLSAVLVITILASSFYIIGVPREYQATTLLLARNANVNQQTDNSFSSLSSLIPLAGRVGGTALNQNASLAVEIIKSRPFFLKLIQNTELRPLLMYSNTPSTKMETFESPEVYSNFIDYKSRVTIEETETGFLKISYRHFTASDSSKILISILEHVDFYLRDMKISEAEESITFLNKELANSSNLSLQRAIASLVQGHIQTKLYASLSTNFIFDVIDPPLSSPYPVYPKRKQFVITVTFVIFFINTLLVVILDYYNRKISYTKELPFLIIPKK